MAPPPVQRGAAGQCCSLLLRVFLLAIVAWLIALRAGCDDQNLSAQGLDPRLAPLACDPAAYDLETAVAVSEVNSCSVA